LIQLVVEIYSLLAKKDVSLLTGLLWLTNITGLKEHWPPIVSLIEIVIPKKLSTNTI
jgi:hypothetical protein